MTSMNITIVAAESGLSESIPVTSNSLVIDLMEWASALLGILDPVLWKDQNPISPTTSTTTLQQVNIQDGDLIMVVSRKNNNTTMPQQNPLTTTTVSQRGFDLSNLLLQGGGASTAATTANNTTTTAASGGSGGLDFSNLLGSITTTTTTRRNVLGPTAGSSTTGSTPNPVYYPGMSLHEAQSYNPHPQAFCQVLLDHEHLRKELNYYNPKLVTDMFPTTGGGTTLEHATKVWREAMIMGGIQSALSATSKYHEERQMHDRLAQNPNDAQAQAYFRNQDRKKRIAEQREHTYEEYPESFASVIMLYINAKINGHEIQAFCDSGAQSTVMSRELAAACGLEDWIDETMAGTAIGVGTRKILGRVHSVELQIGDTHFPCSVTVLEDPPEGAQKMGFLLGLDMMKRHLCVLDLQAGCLKFRLADGKYLETPFLHEKDLDATMGGTKGFDAAKSNEANRKRMEED